jgi:hypothetical protein
MTNKFSKTEVEEIKKSHAEEIEICTPEEAEEIKQLLKAIKEGDLKKSEEDEF